MKPILSVFLASISLKAAHAANSFAGANNYYIYSLPQADRIKILDGMQSAGMKVLRTWVTGHDAGQKESDSGQVNDLEAGGLGNYDDTILNQIDQLMVEAHDRGVKLLIGMHDKNSLQAGDIYGRTYGDHDFYTNNDAIHNFNERITHILNGHKNSLLGNRPWSELGGYIFGYEPQNEPMIFDQTFYNNNLAWICNAAQQIRNNVGDRNQVILTGGGSAASSVKDFFFSSSCPGIDVVEIHDYNDDWDSFMGGAVSQAQSVGKKLMVGEWGSLVGSGRTANMNSNVQKINSYKVPWLYWELISNPDPHQGEDYEIEVNGDDWSTISSAAESTDALAGAPFDFSASLAL